LAEVSSDLDDARLTLKRELRANNFHVLPEARLPLRTQELEQSVSYCLETAALSLHMIGERWGVVAEREPDLQPLEDARKSVQSVVVQQLRLARAAADRGAMQAIVWVPKVAHRDVQTQSFLDEFRKDPGRVRIHEGDLEELRRNVLELLRTPPPAPVPQTNARHVYFLFDQVDRPTAEQINDERLIPPEFEGDEETLEIVNDELLRSSDGVVVYWGTVDRKWVIGQLANVIKTFAGAMTGARPAALADGAIRRGVWLAAPDSPLKQAFRFPSWRVLRGMGDLDDFLRD
jgi:hypothetical protein